MIISNILFISSIIHYYRFLLFQVLFCYFYFLINSFILFDVILFYFFFFNQLFWYWKECLWSISKVLFISSIFLIFFLLIFTVDLWEKLSSVWCLPLFLPNCKVCYIIKPKIILNSRSYIELYLIFY